MKRGFTLIEAMVVIVVMGVLAAVAVPKLFGYIAKAKASEVPIAAATYTKLQDAFLTEKTAIASWDLIGYTPPGNGMSNYFRYEGCIVGEIDIDVAEEGIVGWQAFNLQKLNLCEQNSIWTVTVDPAPEKKLVYHQIVSALGCAYLTLHWDVRAVPGGACEATTQASTPKPESSNSSSTNEPESTESSDPSEDPTNASGESNESNQETQKKCDDLKTGNGNNSDPCSKQAKGWVFVQECNMFAPKGKAQGSGLTIVDLDGDGNADRKKQILDQMCNQTTSSASSSASGTSSSKQSSASQSSASGTSSASQSSNANASSTSTTTPTSTGSGQGGGSGGNGGGGSGGGTGGGSNNNNEPNPEETNGGNDANFETPVPQEVTITKQDGTTTTIDMNNVDNTIKECKSYNTKKDECKNYEKNDISKYDCEKYHVNTSGKVDYCIEKKKDN